MKLTSVSNQLSSLGLEAISSSSMPTNALYFPLVLTNPKYQKGTGGKLQSTCLIFMNNTCRLSSVKPVYAMVCAKAKTLCFRFRQLKNQESDFLLNQEKLLHHFGVILNHFYFIDKVRQISSAGDFLEQCSSHLHHEVCIAHCFQKIQREFTKT